MNENIGAKNAKHKTRQLQSVMKYMYVEVPIN